MGPDIRNKIVYTVKNRCRVCYTCVRECPVKAIKIINGQAEIVPERCIACGNCVEVCSQGAKNYISTIDSTFSLIGGREEVVACVAPSFPAEFSEFTDYRTLIGMVRELGFSKVVEVSFGADLVAKAYSDYEREHPEKTIISSDCPAIVAYVEKYFPQQIGKLAPIVSPMIATVRLLKQKFGNEIKVVFIGPCIAKKGESDEIDDAITFEELRLMFKSKNISPENSVASDFDPPHSAKGAVFPVSKGMLTTIGKCDDVSKGTTIVAEGKKNFREIIAELDAGELDAKHLELLCCEGCIMGPGMSPNGRRYKRRSLISNYVKQKLANLDYTEWQLDMDAFSDMDFSREFTELKAQTSVTSEEAILEVLVKIGKLEEKDHLNCGACGYSTCRKHAIAIVEGLAEDEMCLPYTIEKLHQSIDDLNISNEQLASAKQALRQSEKLAGMGQLSAGIAHELNNPLGVITMYSNILLDESADNDEMRADLELIVEQADRCKKIVGGLLNFARKNQVKKVEIDIEEFCRRSLNSVLAPKNVTMDIESNMHDTMACIDTDQMMQVLTNLEKNAIEAMPNGGTLKLTMEDENGSVRILISDTGSGISQENMDKIFTPFFTTKGLGKGTGLGLPLVYGIVKMHNGQIEVESNADPMKGQTGTTFKISLPRE
ncbi:MAG: 4Fe-4S binding protein [Bacteroidales bacterium]|nr:4Fe-4S binding protein [Bacteroidales bacterium]MCF8456813.1 4Fe-4S binding protein [Bacteroidales bacterium]